MIKVSFDFDSTLSEPHIQKIAKTFIEAGHDVHIVTSRVMGTSEELFSQINSDLFLVATKLGIPNERIHFTDGAFKAETLKRLDMELHYDDMEDEIDLINTTTTCAGLLVGFSKCSSAWFLNPE